MHNQWKEQWTKTCHCSQSLQFATIAICILQSDADSTLQCSYALSKESNSFHHNSLCRQFSLDLQWSLLYLWFIANGTLFGDSIFYIKLVVITRLFKISNAKMNMCLAGWLRQNFLICNAALFWCWLRIWASFVKFGLLHASLCSMEVKLQSIWPTGAHSVTSNKVLNWVRPNLEVCIWHGVLTLLDVRSQLYRVHRVSRTWK